jgi:hypothetical protein
VSQAPLFDGLSLDPFSLQQDGLAAASEFAFSAELADKRRQLHEIENSLSQDVEGTEAADVQAA